MRTDIQVDIGPFLHVAKVPTLASATLSAIIDAFSRHQGHSIAKYFANYIDI